MEYNFRFAEVERKLANFIRLGTVQEVDLARARVRVASGKLLTDWLPWIAHRAGTDRSWSALSIGEQVVVLSPSGEFTQGVVLGSLYQQKHPAPSQKETEACVVFADGSTLGYDQEEHTLKIGVIGKILLQVGESTLALTEEGITLKL